MFHESFHEKSIDIDMEMSFHKNCICKLFCRLIFQLNESLFYDVSHYCNSQIPFYRYYIQMILFQCELFHGTSIDWETEIFYHIACIQMVWFPNEFSCNGFSSSWLRVNDTNWYQEAPIFCGWQNHIPTLGKLQE